MSALGWEWCGNKHLKRCDPISRNQVVLKFNVTSKKEKQKLLDISHVQDSQRIMKLNTMIFSRNLKYGWSETTFTQFLICRSSHQVLYGILEGYLKALLLRGQALLTSTYC